MAATRWRTSAATFTPAAAAYLQGDVIEGAKQFADIGPRAGGTVEIKSAELEVDHNALVASEANYFLYLYSVTPPSAIADNGAWDLPAGDRASFLGKIALTTPVDIGSTLYIRTINLNTPIAVPKGGSVYGYLVTDAGMTPTAAARKVKLHTLET